ncbi:MAG: methyl-accepting chemotaxis protein, partial [Alphaproteobacteria bacterium]|nr:methyl-accepting chemotaxis protein [Alphaproteobacteria bacterium]
ETIKTLKTSIATLTPAQIALQRVNGLISASSNALFRFENRDPIDTRQIHTVLDRLVDAESIALADLSKARGKPIKAGPHTARLRAIFRTFDHEERRDPADDLTAQIKRELFATLEKLKRHVRVETAPTNGGGRASRSWDIFNNLITTTESVLLRYVQRDRITLKTVIRPITAARLIVDSLPFESLREIQKKHDDHDANPHVVDILSAQDALKKYRASVFGNRDAYDSELASTSYAEALSTARRALSMARNKTSRAMKNLSGNIDYVQKSATAAAESRQRLFLALAVLSLILSAAIAYWLRASISRAVGAILDGAAGITAGDFDVRIEARHTDAFGKLAERFNQMAQTLSRKDALLRRTVAELEETKSQLDAAKQDLDDRVERKVDAAQ